MDRKDDRRNSYENKAYFDKKFDSKSSKKLPEDIDSVINEDIPKASLEWLAKFMDKNYAKIVKMHPVAENPLKHAIRTKLEKIPEQMSERQIEKVIAHIESEYPDFKIEKKGDEYIMAFRDKATQETFSKTINYSHYKIEKKFVKIVRVNSEVNFVINTVYDSKYTKAIGLTVVHNITSKRDHGKQQTFVATDEIHQNPKYQLIGKQGNFQRNAQELIQKFIDFQERMIRIQSGKQDLK